MERAAQSSRCGPKYQYSGSVQDHVLRHMA